MAIINEIGLGERVDTDLLKSLASGDPVPARNLYEASYQLVPKAKIWLVGNEIARFNADSGVATRMVTIPFTKPIPLEKQNPFIERVFREEASGILAWALEGAAKWYRDGANRSALMIPDVWTADANDTMEAGDDFIAFTRIFVQHERLKMSSQELYMHYRAWCSINGVRFPLSKTQFIKKAIASSLPRYNYDATHRAWKVVLNISDEYEANLFKAKLAELQLRG